MCCIFGLTESNKTEVVVRQKASKGKLKKDCAIAAIAVGVIGLFGVGIAVGLAAAYKGSTRITLTAAIGAVATGLSLIFIGAGLSDLTDKNKKKVLIKV